MATTVVKTIGSGGDYSTVQAWEDACPASLVAVDQIWEGQLISAATNLSVSGTICNFSGTTVDSTRYKHLTTAAGASFADHTNKATNALRYNPSNGASITSNGNTYAHPIIIGENYVKLSKLQLQGTGGGYIQMSAGYLTIDRCIIRGMDVNGGRIVFAKNTVFQNLRVQCDVAANGTLFENCSFVNASDLSARAHAIRVSPYNGGAFKNCAFFGYTAVREATNATATFTTCYTDSATSVPTGCTTTTYAASFEATTDAAMDARLKAGSALLNNGTTLGTVTADIIGTARPQGAAYDVGAWEVSSGGGNVDGNATGATLTGTSSVSPGAASGQGNATAPGATLTGGSSLTAGSASGGSTGTFTFDAVENNTHSGPLNSVAVNWTWLGGTIGSITSITNGTGTITSSGMTISGLPAGVGVGIIKDQAGTAIAVQEGTVT